MAESLSYQHAKNLIFLLYKDLGFELKVKGQTPGQKIYDVFNTNVKECKVASLFAFVDEYILLLRYVSFYFLSAMPLKDGKKSLIYYRLTVRQINNLSSIRLLCSHGMDISARTVLRLLYETAFVWSRCLVDESFFIAYSKCVTPDDSKQFWYQYLSKGKTESYLKKRMEELGLLWIGNTDERLEHLREYMSVTSHPSHFVDYIHASSDFKGELLVFNPIADSSHFTLSYSLLCISLPFGIFIEDMYNYESIDLWNESDFPTNINARTWSDYHKKVRMLLLELLLFSFKFSNRLSNDFDSGKHF